MTVRTRDSVRVLALAALAVWPTAGHGIEAAKSIATTDRAHLMAQRFAAGDTAAADRPSIDYEMEMLRRARAEAQERQDTSKPAAKSKPAVTAKRPAAVPTVAKTIAAPIVKKPIAKAVEADEARAPQRAVLTVKPFAKATDIEPPRDVVKSPPATAPVITAPAIIAATEIVPATVPAVTSPPVTLSVTAKIQPATETVTANAPPDATASKIVRPLERRQIPSASLTRDGRWVLERRAPRDERFVAPATIPPAKTTEIVETPPPPQRRATRGRDADVRPIVQSAAGIETRTRHHASVLVVLETELSGMVLVDPVLCFGTNCFVSSGLTAAATPHTRDALFALQTTRGVTSDSCRQKSACAFRNVTWTDGDQFEIIDLASTDKKRLGTAVTAVPDTSCRATAGNLACANPVATADFDAWVVPETTATNAGAAALEEVIADDLPAPQMAHAGTSDK